LDCATAAKALCWQQKERMIGNFLYHSFFMGLCFWQKEYRVKAGRIMDFMLGSQFIPITRSAVISTELTYLLP